MTPLTIHLFGYPTILQKDQPIKADTKKAIALLSLLACEDRHEITREKAANLLWQTYIPQRQRANLRRALYSLRNTIGANAIVTAQEKIRLLSNNISCDLWRLQQKRNEQQITVSYLKELISLHEKEFLAGFYLKDAPAFEHWLQQKRFHLDQTINTAIQVGLQTLALQQKTNTAITLAQSWVNNDRMNEVAHRQLIKLYQQQGQINLARKQYEICEDMLQQELGVAPQAETKQLFASLESDRSMKTFTLSAPNQTPSQLTKFIGRHEEINSVQTLLNQKSGFKLIAIEGMGGIGKTTMAIELAMANYQQYSDGILWAQMDKHDLLSILGSFAMSYGRDVSKYQDVESRSQVVRDMLRHKKALIVLDNVEESEQITPLLPTTSNCAVIVTTRKRGLWSLREAVHVELEPFRTDREESLKLFQHHLGAIYVLSHKQTLLQIASLLGHLPLAIDLAASRLAFDQKWKPKTFYKHLQQKTKQMRVLAHENVSVMAAFDLSFSLLTPSEQQNFAALSLFAGKYFEETAVAAVTNQPLEDAQDYLRYLYSLSLIRWMGKKRYALHPLLRAYGDIQKKETAVYTRYIQYFHTFVRQNEKKVSLIEPVREDINHALQITQEQNHPITYIDLSQKIQHYCWICGYYDWGIEHLEKALPLAEPLAKASILRRLAKLTRKKGDMAQSESYVAQGLAQVNIAQHPTLHLDYQIEIATYHSVSRKREEGLQAIQEAVKIAETLPEDAIQNGTWAEIFNLYGALMTHQDPSLAEELLLKALIFAQKQQEKIWIPSIFINLGSLVGNQGNYERATQYYEQSLDISKELNRRDSICRTLTNLGSLAVSQGNYQSSQMYYAQALDVAKQLGHIEYMSFILMVSGEAETKWGDVTKAISGLQAGLQMALEHKIPFNIAGCHLFLGHAYLKQKAFTFAESHFKDGLAIAQTFKSAIVVSLIHNGLGDLYLLKGQAEEAQQQFAEALETATGFGYKEGIGRAKFGMARLCLQNGDVQQASGLAQESLQIFQTLKHHMQNDVKTWLKVHLPTKK